MSNPGQTIEAASVVVPAYNEEAAVEQTVADVRAAMERSGIPYELIIVDDGSTDRTAELAEAAGARVVRLPENAGYGAAIKAGVAAAAHDLIVITDADGTYPAERIPDLIAAAAGYEMVVGARVGEKVAVPLARRPAKWFLRKLASYLAGRPIPDLNSGLRVMRRGLIRRSAHLLPQGFSFTTTITLAALCGGSLVKYVTIDYHPRTGESKIRPRHAFDFLLLIIRTIVYFNPLKVFLPAGAVFFLAGVGKFIYDIYLENLSESAILGVLGAFALWSVGLLSDQLARVAMRNDGL